MLQLDQWTIFNAEAYQVEPCSCDKYIWLSFKRHLPM